MTVGERIRNRRIQLGLTQDELAKKMGYNGRSSVCKAEASGDNLTTPTIRKFAEALDCSFAYLMGFTENVHFVVNVETPNTTKTIQAIVETLNNMPEERQETLLNIIRAYLGIQDD